jgi:hypothetical protein
MSYPVIAYRVDSSMLQRSRPFSFGSLLCLKTQSTCRPVFLDSLSPRWPLALVSGLWEQIILQLEQFAMAMTSIDRYLAYSAIQNHLLTLAFTFFPFLTSCFHQVHLTYSWRCGLDVLIGRDCLGRYFLPNCVQPPINPTKFSFPLLL